MTHINMKELIDKLKIERFFRDIWAFELLELEHLQSLARLATVRKFQPEQILWLQGQSIPHFIVVFIRPLRRNSARTRETVSRLTPS